MHYRQGIHAALQRDLAWWRSPACDAEYPFACGGRAESGAPDVDATLCRIRTQRHDNRGRDAVLTNMVLVRARKGRLSAAILIDPGDGRGPLAHWPARAVATLLQLSTLQDAIRHGRLGPLPDFVAILNPHGIYIYIYIDPYRVNLMYIDI